MEIEVTGKLVAIKPKTSKDYNGKTYYEQPFIVQVDKEYNGSVISQYYTMTAKHEKSLENIAKCQVGQTLKLKVNLVGRKYDDKKTGELKTFLSLEPWYIERVNTAQPHPVNTTQGQPYAGMPQASTAGIDDLPF